MSKQTASGADWPRLEGRRIRFMMQLTATLSRLGLYPDVAKMCRIPVAKRLAIKPAAFMTYPTPTSVRQEVSSIQGRDCPLRIKQYIPTRVNTKEPPVLFIHGGGWIAGGIDTLDYLCANVSAAIGVRVVALEYRLAPDHPFPAGLNDCQDALGWVSKNHLQLGSERHDVTVMGDSAGGNLAAALCLLSRGGSPAVAAQILIYPALDATLQSPSVDYPLPGLMRRDMVALVAAYTGADGDPRDPRISPLLADDIRGLPRTLILSADCDSLRDDAVRYTKRLKEAGVAVLYRNYAGMPHGFFSLPRMCRRAPEALEEVIRFFRAEASNA